MIAWSLVAVCWALLVCVIDLKWRRIPNPLLLLALLPGVGTLVMDGQGLLDESWLSSILGATVALLLWAPGYFLRQMAAGDVKLAFVCGGLLGWPAVVEWSLLSGILLGMTAVLWPWVIKWTRQSSRLPAGMPLGVAFGVEAAFGSGWLVNGLGSLR